MSDKIVMPDTGYITEISINGIKRKIDPPLPIHAGDEVRLTGPECDPAIPPASLQYEEDESEGRS